MCSKADVFGCNPLLRKTSNRTKKSTTPFEAVMSRFMCLSFGASGVWLVVLRMARETSSSMNLRWGMEGKRLSVGCLQFEMEMVTLRPLL